LDQRNVLDSHRKKAAVQFLKGNSALLLRLLPSVLGLAALALVAGLAFYGKHEAYFHLLTLWGFEPFRYPFVDLDGSLAAWECSRKGIDVIISDPCDALARGYTYSPFWMTIDWIPLGRPDRVWVGLALGSAFLVSLSALPSALSRVEIGVRLLAVLSTMTAFAIERANPDLLIFLIVLGAISLLRKSHLARVFGYGLIFLAGAIKYYPFTLLALAARERIGLGISIVIASLAALTGFYAIYIGQIHEGLPNIAKGTPFGDMFGSTNLAAGSSLILQKFLAPSIGSPNAAVMIMVLTGVTIAWAMIRLNGASDIQAALGRIDAPRRLSLLAGSLLLTGCFFAGQNVSYRGIFLFFIIPGMSALAQDKDTGAIAPASRMAMIFLPLLMWTEGIRLWIHTAIAGASSPPNFNTVLVPDQAVDLLPWFGREIGWWFLVGFLLTILICDLVVRPLSCRFHPLFQFKARLPNGDTQ